MGCWYLQSLHPGDEHVGQRDEGARTGTVGIKLEHAEVFSIPLFETSVQSLEMYCSPVGQCLVCVQFAVDAVWWSWRGLAFPPLILVPDGNIPDSRGSLQVVNRSSTTASVAFSSLISLWITSQVKKLFFSLSCQLCLVITAFLNVVSQKQDTFRPQQSDYSSVTCTAVVTKSKGEEHRCEAN